MVEWDNFDFFLRHAVFRANVSTTLFDGVDYVFIRLGGGGANASAVCSAAGNVRTVLVPAGPCDLCAHARALKLLGVTAAPGPPAYSHVVMLNSGVRGPFFTASAAADGAEATWLDVAAAAGTARWQARTVAAPLIGFQFLPHPQTYFLSVPAAALATLAPLFARTCGGTKDACIREGEVQVGHFLFETGFAVHSFGQRYTLRGLRDAARVLGPLVGRGAAMPPAGGDVAADTSMWAHLKALLQHAPAPATAGERAARRASAEVHLYNVWSRDIHHSNPATEWTDPCRNLFVKLGGVAWRERFIRPDVIAAVRRLTLAQEVPARMRSSMQAVAPGLFAGPGKCQWFA
jgi:hypothetical protein